MQALPTVTDVAQYHLTEDEINEHLIACPRCQEPAFLEVEMGAGVLVVCAGCGFNAEASAVDNMPPDWMDEARAEDALEDVRERALELLESGTPGLAAAGEELLTLIDTGMQDQVGAQRLKKTLVDLGAGDVAEAIGRIT